MSYFPGIYNNINSLCSDLRPNNRIKYKKGKTYARCPCVTGRRFIPSCNIKSQVHYLRAKASSVLDRVSIRFPKRSPACKKCSLYQPKTKESSNTRNIEVSPTPRPRQLEREASSLPPENAKTRIGGGAEDQIWQDFLLQCLKQQQIQKVPARTLPFKGPESNPTAGMGSTTGFLIGVLGGRLVKVTVNAEISTEPLLIDFEDTLNKVEEMFGERLPSKSENKSFVRGGKETEGTQSTVISKSNGSLEDKATPQASMETISFETVGKSNSENIDTLNTVSLQHNLQTHQKTSDQVEDENNLTSATKGDSVQQEEMKNSGTMLKQIPYIVEEKTHELDISPKNSPTVPSSIWPSNWELSELPARSQLSQARASSKGASPTAISLLFSCYAGTSFIIAPVCGKLLDKIEDVTTFMTLSFIVRILEATGYAAYNSAIFAYLATQYQDHVCTLLYWLREGFGGYITPFVVLGFLFLFSVVLAAFVAPADPPYVPSKKESMWKLLRTPPTVALLSSVYLSAVAMTCLLPTLAPHLAEIDIDAKGVGLFFFIQMTFYALCGPLSGYIADRLVNFRLIMMAIGFLGAGMAFFLLGPSSWLGINSSTGSNMAGMILHGGFLPLVVVPGYGAIFQSALEVSGPIIAGTSLETYTFDNIMTAFGIFFICAGIVFFGFDLIWGRKKRNRVKFLQELSLYTNKNLDDSLRKFFDKENYTSSYGTIPS
ncbi:unnamed protein product [Cyprideis torosa]|uniref:Uncharacterized protein n=1 Tax=Cyprideis torosa TaxID=163714 RepID=A0A7R8W6B7_9CRUS|nr:unnamed protein product [Cyprideis torosa]CAG0881592.1 unnamed protein product [Cyprideis torosa]